MKHYIKIEETRTAIVEVEAESSEEAIEKVSLAYSEDILNLDNGELIDDADFCDETKHWASAVKRGVPVVCIRLPYSIDPD